MPVQSSGGFGKLAYGMDDVPLGWRLPVMTVIGGAFGASGFPFSPSRWIVLHAAATRTAIPAYVFKSCEKSCLACLKSVRTFPTSTDVTGLLFGVICIQNILKKQR